MFLFLKKEIHNQGYQHKESVMKKLGFGSKVCLTALLCGVSVLGLSVGNKVEATDTDTKEIEKPFMIMKISESEEEIIDEIVNGRFRSGVDYLAKLPLPKVSYNEEEDTDSSMLAYAYQVLGRHYIDEDNASNAAIAYFRSLKADPFNYELICYLKELGVRSFSSKENIEKVLAKIVEK